ncbi:phosphoribosyltransferase, partial [Nakamurella sp.]|uniref:phosphoribosyltransferase n=1 Tax=Nakamurella sp. TaxID=1869182 RepID=UPI003B3BD6F6
PVAVPVARAVRAPLDVLLVRKIGVPGQPELAMGAVAAVAGASAVAGAGEPDGSGGPGGPTGAALDALGVVEVVRNELVLDRLRLPAAVFAGVLDRELTELHRRMSAYRGDRPPPVIRGRAVVVVDDGLATGSTMRAAVAAVRRLRPARVLVAVPVGAADSCARLRECPDVDDVLCARCPVPFGSVGQGYRDFGPTSDDEVRAGLAYDLRG